MRFHRIQMRYSIEPKGRIYVKGYGFLSFAKNIGKNLSNKYVQKLLESAERSTVDVIKTASKRAIQKTAEAAGDLIGNKIADRITSVSKSTQQSCSQKMMMLVVKQKYHKKIKVPKKKKDIYLQKKDNKLLIS